MAKESETGKDSKEEGLKLARLTKQARVRKRNSDKKQGKAVMFCLGVCLFSMAFVMASTARKEESTKVIVLDPSGTVHDGEAIAFEHSKRYHEHLMHMAISGIYARDENGAMNNNLEMIGSVNVINQRNTMYESQDKLFREKRIVQFPRVVGYMVDVVSSRKMVVKAKIQVIREAFTLAGNDVKGIENINLLLEYEANDELGKGHFQPWNLVTFQEVEQQSADKEGGK